MKALLLAIISLVFFLDIQAQKNTNPYEELFDAVEYRHIGPFRGGRSCAVTGVPGKPNLFYFGATGGGVWKTEDGGRSWENISDGFFGGSIGSIAVAQSDPNVIYVGGGEKTVRGNVSYGYGVWKSVDAGKTWKSLGLEKSRHVSRIRIDPNNADVAYAAVMGNLFADDSNRGVYKTTDGGKTWKKVLYANPSAGAVDLIIDPNNSRVLYASTWKIRRTPYSLSSGGEGSALYKSIDYGETWENISENKGLPKGTWGIVGVTVSPQNSERVWALIENEKGGLFRSDDAGKSWQKTNDERSLRQRAWYYTRLYADTEDEDVVYVVNVNYHKSKDGGKTFKSANAPHGDHHDLWIDPSNSKRMIIGDDGGAQVSYDGGETWSTYHNQPTAQFYRVTTDNHFPYRIYAAQQDNSTIRISHRTAGRSIGEDAWERTAGGESAHIAPDPTDPEIVYGGSYGGFLTRRDHRTDDVRAINVWPDNPMGHGAEGMKYRFQWNFPIFFSKHDSKKLYTASNHLHVSTDEGQSWEIISPDLTRNDPEKLKSSGGPITQDNTGVEYYCTIFAADESSLKEGMIWVGSDDGLVHLTQDGGKNWSNVTPSNAPKWLMINDIQADPFDEAGCYVVGTLYKGGDFKPYIYKTSNYGKTWKKIVNGIDSEHFTRAIEVDPVQKGLLYAGTETGMYISNDDGNSWKPFQLNLPIVPITDLAYKNNNLIVATQGRSLWMIDDLGVIRQAYQRDNTNTHLFKPADAYRMRGSQSKNVKGSGLNHPGGVNVYFYLEDYDEKEDSLSISFIDSAGNTIKKLSTKAEEKHSKIKVEKGSNTINWNLKSDPAKDFKGMILWWGSLAGATSVPGDYKVKMDYRGQSWTEAFKILQDPRLTYSNSDMKQQQDFVNEINEKVSDAHGTIDQIKILRTKMSDFKKEHESDLIADKISEIDSTMTAIEKNLYQTKNRSRQDPLNFPIKLTNKLAHLNSLVQLSDAPPTDQMYAVKKEMIDLIDIELKKFEQVKQTDIKALNELVKREVTDFFKIKDDDKE